MAITGDLAIPGLDQVPGPMSADPAPVGGRPAAGSPEQLVHDIRQPVAVMRILLTAVAGRPDLPAEVAETIAQVNDQATWLAELIGQWPGPPAGGPAAAMPADVEAAPDQSPSHVLDVLGSVIDSVQVGRAGRLTVQVRARPWVRLPAAALRRALTNLVDNAVRCAGPDGVVRLGVGVTGGRAYVEVQDDGAGFRPGPGQRAVGLCIVTEIAAAAGGSLELGASGLGGVRAVFRVPVIRTRPDRDRDEPAAVR